MTEEEKKALKVINARTRRLLDELEIEKEDMSDEPRIAYLMQEIRANKTILNLIEKLQKENNKLNIKLDDKEAEIQILKDDIKADDIEYKHVIEILKKENEEYSKQLDLDYVDKNYIPKQKIKAKIEELNKTINKGGIIYSLKQCARCQKDVLEKLLIEESED